MSKNQVAQATLRTLIGSSFLILLMHMLRKGNMNFTVDDLTVTASVCPSTYPRQLAFSALPVHLGSFSSDGLMLEKKFKIMVISADVNFWKMLLQELRHVS